MISLELEESDRIGSASLGYTEMEDAGEGLNYLPLADNCHHYEHISEVPWDIHK